MVRLRKVQPRQLIVGDKVPNNIYTLSRVLLLARGSMVESQQQAESLLSMGYFDPDEKDITRDATAPNFQGRAYTSEINPFLELDAFYQRLFKITKDLSEGRKPEAVESTVTNIATELLVMARSVPNALLGAAHWPKDLPSASLMHSLRCAVVIAVVAQRLKLSADLLQATLCAALTANLSMLDLQEKLNSQQEPLDGIQKSRIFAHPEKSVFLLESLGVTNKLWLEAVMQHHERLDGSGYPKKLQGSAIGTAARLIALADSYTAMTAWREYRPLLTPRQAMRQMLGEEQELLDSALGRAFLSQLGIYPPSSLVSLANGDIAVVIERGVRINEPVCAAIRSAAGQSYLPPPRRDSSNADYAIQKVLNHAILKKIQPFLFWDINTSQKMQG